MPFFSLLNAANNLNSVLTKGGMGRDYNVKNVNENRENNFKSILNPYWFIVRSDQSFTSPTKASTCCESYSTALSVFWKWSPNDLASWLSNSVIELWVTLHFPLDWYISSSPAGTGSRHILNPSSMAASLWRASVAITCMEAMRREVSGISPLVWSLLCCSIPLHFHWFSSMESYRFCWSWKPV